MTDEKIKIYEDMIYLSGCALNGVIPEKERLTEMDFENLYRECRNHSIGAMIGMVLGRAESEGTQWMSPELIAGWKELYGRSVHRQILFQGERKKIFRFCEEKGIWYMPLKGVVLKDLYPRAGMREMADNDILYDGKFQQEIASYMTSHGYDGDIQKNGCHDVYQKKPIYNFELHSKLFTSVHVPVWYQYYETIAEKMLKDEGNAYGYHFSDEDFYIYMMAHACKHYRSRGTGIRSLLDCYIYVREKGKDLNWKYIEAELEKMELAEFEKEVRSLCGKLFEDPLHFENLKNLKLSRKEEEMLKRIFSSGTYGTIYNYVQTKLKEVQADDAPIQKSTKWKYYWKRLFPDLEWLRKNVPFVYRNKWLIPFYYSYRLIHRSIFHGKYLKNEIKAVRKVK